MPVPLPCWKRGMGSTRVRLSGPSEEKGFSLPPPKRLSQQSAVQSCLAQQRVGPALSGPCQPAAPSAQRGQFALNSVSPSPNSNSDSIGVGLGRETRSWVRLGPPPSSRPQQRASWTARLRRRRARGPSAPGRRVPSGRSGARLPPSPRSRCQLSRSTPGSRAPCPRS